MSKINSIIYFLFILQQYNAQQLNLVQIEYCQNAGRVNSPTCDCSAQELSGSNVGTHIDCSYLHLESVQLPEVPADVIILNLSWNSLTQVPVISEKNQLEELILMHNNIKYLSKQQFKNYKLKKLYLNWNSIQHIEMDAFESLTDLLVLDLSHNNIQDLALKAFGSLHYLQTLSLAWNRKLELNTKGNFYENYLNQSETAKQNSLVFLSLEACGLSSIELPSNISLEVLNLRGNEFTNLPQLALSVKNLDLSGNLFNELPAGSFAHVTDVEELYLEDLPQLENVAENALSNFQSLRKLTLQNSRHLTYFDSNAFGIESSIKELSFRGTGLRTLNGTGTLYSVVSKLEKLDLYGVPLVCDCHLTWLKELEHIKINGVCMQPTRLRGRRIADISVSEFDCRTWPDWFYGIVIFSLLIFIAACIYIMLIGLRPHRGVTLRHKVGSGSPYARVTIEPNNQENNYY